MKILACGAIPTAVITMTIGKMHTDHGVVLTEIQEEGHKGFWTTVPRSVANKLEVGDKITIVCIPMRDFSFATETLAVEKHIGEKTTRVIFDRGDYSKNFRF